MSEPLVSVVIPVYNSQQFLRQAIDGLPFPSPGILINTYSWNGFVFPAYQSSATVTTHEL